MMSSRIESREPLKHSHKTAKKRGGGLHKVPLYPFLGLFFFGFISFFTVMADDTRVLYRSESYKYTQKNANELIAFAEFLGRSKFSAADKKALQLWSIRDFSLAPDKATNYYKNLSEKIMPKIKAMRKQQNNEQINDYRADMYLGYINLFNKHPEYKTSPDNILAVIDRYNPPVKEAMQLQQLIFNSIQQTLIINQQIFNQSMRLQQKSSDVMINSIRDQAVRNSISIPGGTVLEETQGKFYAEDEKGNKFEVTR